MYALLKDTLQHWPNWATAQYNFDLWTLMLVYNVSNCLVNLMQTCLIQGMQLVKQASSAHM